MKDKMREYVYPSIVKWFRSKSILMAPLFSGFAGLYQKWWRQYSIDFLKDATPKKGMYPHSAAGVHLSKPPTTLKDWLQANDLLASLIRKRQTELNSIQVHSLTFDLLGLSAYLMRLHLCLAHHKKYYQIYERREAALNVSEKENHLAFLNARLGCEEIGDVLNVCIGLLKEMDIKKDTLKAKVVALSDIASLMEKQTETLAKAVERLNETVLKQGSLYNLLENDLFKVMHNLDASKNQLILHSNLYFKEPVSQAIPDLREQAAKIKNIDLQRVAHDLILQYEILNKYLIFTHSRLLNETFALFYKQIKQFMDQIIELESQNKLSKSTILSLHPILNSIFRTIQSIRFITNKKDSFARNLQKAVGSSTKQLRKNLENTKVGQDFLNLYYRMDMREKLKMRSRFKP